MGLLDRYVNTLTDDTMGPYAMTEEDRKKLKKRGLLQFGLELLKTPTGQGGVFQAAGRAAANAAEGVQAGGQQIYNDKYRADIMARTQDGMKRNSAIEAAMSGILNPDGSLNQEKWQLLAQTDPEKAVAIRQKIEGKQQGAPQIKTIYQGDQEVQMAWDGKQFVPVSNYMGGEESEPAASPSRQTYEASVLAEANKMAQMKVPEEIVNNFVTTKMSQQWMEPAAQQSAPVSDFGMRNRYKTPEPKITNSPAKRSGSAPEMGDMPPKVTPANAKQSKASAVMLAQLPALQRRIDRLQEASDSISGFFDGGPVDQFALKLTPENSELESAAAQLKPVLMSFVRVPGIGAQSDLEARLDSLQYPDASQPPQVRNKNIQELKAFIKDLTSAMSASGQSEAPARRATDEKKPASNYSSLWN